MSELVWKYMEIDTYTKILDSSKLRITRIDQYEDKWEGRYQGTQKVFMDFASSLRIKTLHNNVFVSCWSKRNAQSMAMWDIYARNGVALVSTTTKLKLFVDNLELSKFTRFPFGESSVLTKGVDNVIYGLNPNAVRYLNKRECFDHEAECRIFFGVTPGNHLPIAIDVAFNISDIVDQVIISPRADKAIYEKVLEINEKHNFRVSTIQSDVLAE